MRGHSKAKAGSALASSLPEATEAPGLEPTMPQARPAGESPDRLGRRRVRPSMTRHGGRGAATSASPRSDLQGRRRHARIEYHAMAVDAADVGSHQSEPRAGLAADPHDRPARRLGTEPL